ncbi:MAG: methyltransferase domain-containing protein [Pseudomonadota bacterium]
MPDYDLDNAYEIKGPESAKDLYGKWAQSYDDSFGADWGYVAPKRIAELYLLESEDDTPILDIGAGTGLVAEHLAGAEVDALDITPEMLRVAEAKGIYRDLHEGDLLKPLALADGAYRGVISCGTFTHGHVGPACLPELLRVTQSGALFVCGTIPAVLDGMGFGSALAVLQARGVISPLRFADIEIYENKDHPHAHDRGLVMLFRKL